MLQTLAVQVPGMSCAHCTGAVEREVAALPGVESVHADLATKVVTVTGTGLDDVAIRAAIADAGYEAER